MIPIKYDELVRLPALGLPQDIYKQANLTMESDRYICLKEGAPDGSILFDIVDLGQGFRVQKKAIPADAAMMHPTKPYFCIRTGVNIQVRVG